MAKPTTSGNGGKTIIAADDLITVPSNLGTVTDYTITKAQLLANDTLGKNVKADVTAVKAISGGTAFVDRDGTVHVHADNQFNPDVTFSYTITDSKTGASSTATATIDYQLPNHAPIAMDDTVVQHSGGAKLAGFGLGSSFVLPNDRDPDGDPLTLLGATSTDGNATVSLRAVSGVQFIDIGFNSPTASGQFGVDYVVGDNHGAYATAHLDFILLA